MRREVIEFLLHIAEQFFSDSCRYNYFPSSFLYQLWLATPPPAPYTLKHLSITLTSDDTEPEFYEPGPDEDFRFDHEIAASISSTARSIILFQLHSLEHASINLGTDFCYRKVDYDLERSPASAERSYSMQAHRELLSTLTDLLKQPQLQSLSVGRAPLTEAYQLVEVFLCTETTHSLSLTIEGVEEESKWIQVQYTGDDVEDDDDDDDDDNRYD